MAELILAAIGVVGVAVTAADVGLKSLDGLRTRIHKSNKYHKELVLIQTTFLAYQGVLRALKNMTENLTAGEPATQTLEPLSRHIDSCQQAMDVVNERLQNFEKSFISGHLKLAFHRIIDSRTEAALKELDRTKPALDLALQTDLRTCLASNRLLGQEIEHEVNEVKDKTNNIKKLTQTLVGAGSIEQTKSLLADFLKVDVQAALQSYLQEVRHQARSGTWLLTSADWRQWMLQSGRPILLRGRCKWRMESKLCCH